MRGNPFSETGHDIRELERKLNEKADKHELASLRGDVDRLERANGELRSEIDGLRSRCDWLEENLRQLMP